MKSVILAATIFLAAAAPPSWLPDPAVTPGATNPAVTQSTIGQTICRAGWATAQRPPMSFTENLKRRQLRADRYADKRLGHYREDHLVPLEVGGAARDSRNLWPSPRIKPCDDRAKDRLENVLHRLVCSGRVALADAQAAFVPDWTVGYRRYIGPLVCKVGG